MLCIFDLDDTLVQYYKMKIIVPRQTFHALRNLSYKNKLAIISFNRFADFIAHSTGLIKYITKIVCGLNDRVELMKKILINESFSTIHYWDDRLDNLECIQKYFPFIEIHHVKNPCLLFQSIAQVQEKDF